MGVVLIFTTRWHIQTLPTIGEQRLWKFPKKGLE